MYFGNPLAHPTVTIDRRRTGELQYTSGFPDAEDLALWRTLSRRGVALANLDRVLLHYRVHAASATAQDSAQVGSSYVDAIVVSSRWRADRARWAISRTFNARARGVTLWAFLAGVTALNLLNLRRPEVSRASLARRSALGIAAWLRQADRNRR